jgi:FimV-like protein
VKKFKRVLSFFLLLCPIFAAANTNLFDNSVSRQAYHQAGVPLAPVPAASTAAPKTAVTSPNSNSTNTAPTSSPVLPKVNNSQNNSRPMLPNSNPSSLQELQSELSQQNQVMLMLQQQADQRIEALSVKNGELAAKLKRLQQALVLLNQEVNVLNVQAQAQLKNQIAKHASPLPTKHLVSFIILGIVVISGILFLLINRFKTKKTPADLKEKEYDFMGSPEGVAANLDLARAYLAMEDYAAAQKILKSILENGNPEQQEQARELLFQKLGSVAN